MIRSFLASLPFVRDIPGVEPVSERQYRKYRELILQKRPETLEGRNIIREAFSLSYDLQYRHLTNAELIRLVYWGVSGKPYSSVEEEIASMNRLPLKK